MVSSVLVPWYKKEATLLKNDQLIVKKRFPALQFIVVEEKMTLAGKIAVRLENPDIIDDEYDIKIVFPEDYPSSLPKVFETGGRKETISEAREVSLGDLHFNIPDKSACLSATIDSRLSFPQKSSIDVFIDKMIAPFFCGLSYYELHGKFPWGEYSHNGKGILESYAHTLGVDDPDLIMRAIKLIGRLKSHRSCPCTSGKRILDCHPALYKKMVKIKGIMTKKEINEDFEKLVALVR